LNITRASYNQGVSSKNDEHNQEEKIQLL